MSTACEEKSDHRDIEEKILSMYAKGMTASDIEGHIREIYGLDCSDTTISRITDKIRPVVRVCSALKRNISKLFITNISETIHEQFTNIHKL